MQIAIKDICPLCKDNWCAGASDEAMIYKRGTPCPTYYDGCHCCNLCAGFPKCSHGTWASQKCYQCKKDIIRRASAGKKASKTI